MTILDSLAQKIQSTSRAPVIANPTKYSRRSDNITAPVNEVKLSYYEEQRLYDRMYEAKVYKNGRFFGYRSTTNQRWHDDEESTRIANDEKLDWTRLASIVAKQELLQDEHAEWLARQDNAAAAREQHKRKTRG